MPLLALLPLTLAFELTGEPWPADQLPVAVRWAGALHDLSDAELDASIQRAAAAWSDTAACAFGFTVARASLEDFDAPPVAGEVRIVFGDPDDLFDEGVIGATITGLTTAPPSYTLVLNDGPYWTTGAAIAAGACTDQRSVDAYLAHELGHVAGLGDSCPLGEPCTDPDARAATMYPLAVCDDSAATLSDDDVAGLLALYGTPVVPDCTVTDAAARVVTCEVRAPADSTNARWDFGDGTSAEGASVSHTYAADGAYSVTLCAAVDGCDVEACAAVDVRVGEAEPPTASSDEAAAELSGGCAAVGGVDRVGICGMLVGIAALLRRARG